MNSPTPTKAKRTVRPIPPALLAKAMRDDRAFNRRLDGKPRHLRVEPSLPLWELAVCCAVAFGLGFAWWVL